MRRKAGSGFLCQRITGRGRGLNDIFANSVFCSNPEHESIGFHFRPEFSDNFDFFRVLFRDF